MSNSLPFNERVAIVADIGGTNARFACVDVNHLMIKNIVIYRCADFPSFADVFLAYQQQQKLTAVKQAVIAVACLVQNDFIRMTNFHWQFSVDEMKQHLSLNRSIVLNDFTAAAMSLTKLPSNKATLARFEAKGRFHEFNRQIATYVVTAEQPGLLERLCI